MDWMGLCQRTFAQNYRAIGVQSADIIVRQDRSPAGSA
jgi:hypothetical protein